MILDWDDAYANAPHILDSDAFPARWEATAAAYRAALPPDRLRAGLAYGSHPREKVDLFLPVSRPTGLVVLVHGGYWRRFDQTVFSHLAAGAVDRGWAVAMPGYPLAPEVRISGITRSVGAAIAQAAEVVAGPIRLAGHSAGGHLVARQVCADSPLPPAVLKRIGNVLSISGLHDLRPLLRLALNADLRLDAGEAAAESTALSAPLPGTRLHAWVGDVERPEFIRQSTLIANIWCGLGADTQQTIEMGKHHFDVIDGLVEPASALVHALIA